MTKTLSEKVQALTLETEAIANDVKGFREKTLDAYPGFSYGKLRVDQPEVYSKIRRVEARMGKVAGKSIFYQINLNEKWWALLHQGLVQQEQFAVEIERMWQIYLNVTAH